MPGRPDDWGAKLAELRKSTGLSAAAVVNELKDLGIDLDRASIYAYEAGRVAAPDARVVWGLAQIYGVKLDELVGVLVDARVTLRPPSSNQPSRLRLSRAEFQVLERLRKLTPSARKACLEFIDFQIQRSASKHRRKPRHVPR